MRFARYRSGGAVGLALVEGNGPKARGLDERDPAYPGDLAKLIAEGPAALEAAAKALSKAPTIDLSGEQLLPPLPHPGKIICIGLNYRDHTAESGFKQPDYPTVFVRFASSLTGHGATVVRPKVSEQLDYEGELVAVIGKRGRRIGKARALDHVIGYSIFNDVSVRDYQFKSPQWTMGKNFDTTGPFGPWFVTSDELPPGGAGLKIETRLNGTAVQSANTTDMVFDVATLVTTLSEVMTLEPGDIIVSGTPAGVGVSRKPQLFMKAGDRVEVEIEKIGTLVNTVADE